MTIDDIARELNISKTTVSRAISGKGRIGKATREKVLTYIRENNYRPNALAKGLAESKTFNIGFVMPGEYEIADLPFFQRCMWGISTKAAELDYDVILSMVREGDLSQLVRLIDHHKVDGIILGRTLEKDEPLEYLKQVGIPFVAIGSTADQQVFQIDNDHLAGCRELTGRLLDQGLRKIALIGGRMSHMVNRKRLMGYQEAFEKRGLSAEEGLIFTDVAYGAETEAVVKELLRQKTECILCMDDAMCSSVLHVLGREKIRIPEEIQIASFYHSSILEGYRPAITSLQFDVTELGMESCRMLMDCMNQKEAAKKKLLGYKLTIKESTQI